MGNLISNLEKPILHSVSTFDPAKGCTLEYEFNNFSSTYSDIQVREADSHIQVVGSTCSEGTDIWRAPSPKLYHAMSSTLLSQLSTGKRYQVRLRAVNSVGDYSNWSDYQTFKCVLTPTFEFTNITPPSNGSSYEIETSSYDLLLNYEQSEGELLSFYRIYVYDKASNEISGASPVYVTDYVTSGIAVTSSITYRISGLEDNCYYTIKAVGETANGLAITTKEYSVFVDYEKSQNFYTLEISSNHQDGTVTYTTNVVSIDYYGDDKDSLVYETDNGTKSIIVLDSSSIYYDDGITFDNDFLIKFKGYNFNTSGEPLFVLKNPNTEAQIKLSCVEDDQGGLRFVLDVSSENYSSFICTDSQDLDPTVDAARVIIMRKSGIYYIYVYIYPAGVSVANVVYGKASTSSSVTSDGTVYIYNASMNTASVSSTTYTLYIDADEPTPVGYDVWIGGTA